MGEAGFGVGVGFSRPPGDEVRVGRQVLVYGGGSIKTTTTKIIGLPLVFPSETEARVVRCKGGGRG